MGKVKLYYINPFVMFTEKPAGRCYLLAMAWACVCLCLCLGESFCFNTVILVERVFVCYGNSFLFLFLLMLLFFLFFPT